jgi:hypothetical protein
MRRAMLLSEIASCPGLTVVWRTLEPRMLRASCWASRGPEHACVVAVSLLLSWEELLYAPGRVARILRVEGWFMARAAARGRSDGDSRRPSNVEDLPDFCSRPSCRREFRRLVGPGRRQAYCSETCRRNAEKELRQAKSRLAHFEELVKMLRSDVAAFERTAAEQGAGDGPLADLLQGAESALRRAEGALIFADGSQPSVQELRRLYEAVAPLILAQEIAS